MSRHGKPSQPVDLDAEGDDDEFMRRVTDTEGVLAAITRAVRRALLEHKKLGYPIVIWKDGKVVRVPPEEIEVD